MLYPHIGYTVYRHYIILISEVADNINKEELSVSEQGKTSTALYDIDTLVG